jgi:hypothetical protein
MKRFVEITLGILTAVGRMIDIGTLVCWVSLTSPPQGRLGLFP